MKTPRNTSRPDDCLRMAVAALLERRAGSIPYIPACGTVNFWHTWRLALAEIAVRPTIWAPGGIGYGLAVAAAWDAPVRVGFPDREFWIAVVPDLWSRGHHAVVLHTDRRIAYDSAFPSRQRRPRKIFYGITLDPV